MTTAVKGVNNKSNAAVYFVNHENHGDDRTIPGNSVSSAHAWISQHRNSPLEVKTSHGTLSVWDQDWKIMYRWANDNEDTVWKWDFPDRKDWYMTINEQGYVFID